MRQVVFFSSLCSACVVLAPRIAAAPAAEPAAKPPASNDAATSSSQSAPDDELDFEGTAEVEAPPRDVTKHSVENQLVQHMPGTRGDALRAIEIMPGVARTSLGQGDRILRGAAAGKSQVFLDGIQWGTATASTTRNAKRSAACRCFRI